MKAINTLTLVSSLFTAIDTHQAAVDNTTVTFNSRDAALVAIRAAGYTSVQDGRKKTAPKKGELKVTDDIKEYFNTRFLNMVKTRHIVECERAAEVKAEAMPFIDPTMEQIAANLKQQTANLNHYLKNGVFTTNVGREKAKIEELETAKIIHAAERKAEAEAKKAAEAKAALLAVANREALAKAAEAERIAAEALAKAEAEAEAAEVKRLQAEALEAAKAAATKKPNSAEAKAALKLIAKLEAEAEAAEAARKARDIAEAKAAEAERVAAEVLAAEVLKAASDTIKANKQAEAAAAEVKRLQAEADKKAADKKTKGVDLKQLEDNFYKSIISQLSEDGVESLINRLTMFLDLN